MCQIHNYFTSNTPISSKNLLVKFFKHYVQPRYLYGIIIYGTTTKSILTKLKTTKFFSQNSLSIKEIGRGSHDKKKALKKSLAELGYIQQP